jgi:hypothetical protein
MQIQSINSTMQLEPAAWSISASCIDASVSTAFYILLGCQSQTWASSM